MSDRIFISYSRSDQEFVSKLARDLELRGGRVWLDQTDIRGGIQWRQSIADGIEESGAFLVILSPDSMESEYVNLEIELAETQGKPIFPLVYRRTKRPENLSRFQFIDFTWGGYQKNLTDLLVGLSTQGIAFTNAPELSAEVLADRRRERMGAPVKVRWGIVFRKIPGWALAWGLGWGIFWVFIAILMALSDNASGEVFLLPVGGFVGGLIGGFLAGLVTMISLRHHAANISWKHMRSSIRIWGFVGPIGSAIAFGLVLFLVDAVVVDAPESSNIVEAIGGAFAAGLVSGIATAFVMAIALLFYSLIAFSVIGGVAGWFAVRHIRRLEPGILGKQAIWVVIGWGISAPMSAILSILVLAPFLES
jgi:hypothetical protein